MEQIKISDLMSSEINCVPPDTTLSSVAELMTREKHSCMVIGTKQPVGIITERDLVHALLHSQDQPNLLSQPASEFMSSPVVTLKLDESLYDAIVVSKSENVRHLPVVNDDNQLQGIVTQSDIANAHFRVVEMQAELIEQNIAEKTEVLQQANAELQALSLEDHLMQVGNRRAMEVDLQHTHDICQRYQRNYSIALIDVDFFKRYNDHYGHSQGDEALRRIAQALKETLRASDRIYRYGGEELLVLFPETPHDSASLVAQRLLSSVYGLKIPHIQSDYGVLTISAGISSFNPDTADSDWKNIVEKADNGLYSAKSSGRNKVGQDCD